MNITTIELPIYHLDIVILISDSWETYNKKFKLNLDSEYLSAHAVTTVHPEYKEKHEIYLLLKPKYLDYNTLCHELMHLVMYICDLKGIRPEQDNDEPLAYLQGYLAEELFKFRDLFITKSLEANQK
jgi:hypothetical protein